MIGIWLVGVNPMKWSTEWTSEKSDTKTKSYVDADTKCW